MHLTVNGKSRELAGPLNLREFLEAHNVNPAMCAVEYNGEIVRRDRFTEVDLQEGDKLEIIHMVGGGA
jgi:thiamine biosynthesis protein ThiS